MEKKVLVTGGSGFVGSRLKLIKPDWTYLSSKDVNLLSFYDVWDFLRENKPDAVIHLAGRIGGIKDNAEHPAEFFHQNVMMNTNVVHACYKAGVQRLLASLSTCAFPDTVDHYPFTEKDILNGPPAETNRAYGFAKRALHIQLQSYRKQYLLNYSSFCPSNLYGPGDCFDYKKSHFVAAMIRKIVEAPEGGDVTFWGTGKPWRQQLFVDDLCRAIPDLLELHSTDKPLIISPDENLSIGEMIRTFISMIGKEVNVKFNGKLDGQFRKDGSNGAFRALLPDFRLTSFYQGLKKTYEWYKKENSSNNRS